MFESADLIVEQFVKAQAPINPLLGSRGNKRAVFVKGWFLRMWYIPSFRVWGPGTSKVVVARSFPLCTAGKDYLEEISVQGNICQNPLLETTPWRTPN